MNCLFFAATLWYISSFGSDKRSQGFVAIYTTIPILSLFTCNIYGVVVFDAFIDVPCGAIGAVILSDFAIVMLLVVLVAFVCA